MKGNLSIGEIKQKSFNMLRGRWTTAVILALFYALFNGVASGLQVYLAEAKTALLVIVILLSFAESFLDLGMRLGMLGYSRGQVPTVGCIFDAARYYPKALFYYIPVKALFLLMNAGMLWLSGYLMQNTSGLLTLLPIVTMLAVLFGLAVLTAGFMPMLYLILDHPDIKIGALYATAWKYMRGNKIKLVLMQISFFGCFLLGVLTCGIALLFAIPYLYVAESMFYNELIPAENEESEQ